VRAAAQRFLDRVGNPLEWGDIDKALIIQAVAVPGVTGGVPRLFYMLAHRETEPYYDRRAVKHEPEFADIYVVLLTAKGQELDRQKGAEVGADLYMTKPFDPDELLQRARQCSGCSELRMLLRLCAASLRKGGGQVDSPGCYVLWHHQQFEHPDLPVPAVGVPRRGASNLT